MFWRPLGTLLPSPPRLEARGCSLKFALEDDAVDKALHVSIKMLLT